MRRALVVLVIAAFAALALGGAALAKEPDVSLTVTPTDPKAGDSVLLQAYLQFGTKPYQGANVEFIVTGPGMKQGQSLHAKPGKPGIYTAQFTAPAQGFYQIATRVDGVAVSEKPYPLEVRAASVAAATEWMPLAAGIGALAILVGIAAAILRRGRFTKTIPATN
jgi:hypothetical protein